MDTTALGDLQLSRLLLGSNPFSGFSHQGVDRDERMVHHYSVARIKEALFEAERLGVTGLVARTDFHVMRMLLEYRDDGGKLQWLAQTCPEVGDSEACARRAAPHIFPAAHYSNRGRARCRGRIHKSRISVPQGGPPDLRAVVPQRIRFRLGLEFRYPDRTNRQHRRSDSR